MIYLNIVLTVKDAAQVDHVQRAAHRTGPAVATGAGLPAVRGLPVAERREAVLSQRALGIAGRGGCPSQGPRLHDRLSAAGAAAGRARRPPFDTRGLKSGLFSPRGTRPGNWRPPGETITALRGRGDQPGPGLLPPGRRPSEISLAPCFRCTRLRVDHAGFQPRSRRPGPLRPVWRPLRARDAHPGLDELAVEYEKARLDETFQAELADLLRYYVGRPSPLYHARRLSQQCGGAQIYLKREDLNHTGAHKINNTLGQALLTLRMGKRRVIAETGAGQHGVATATACARFGLECVVYMGEEDIRRQAPNVFSMKLLGAEVRPVNSGSRTLRDAINEAMRDWMSSVETTHYIIGSVVGPHPFPRIVRDFQSVIGRETIAQAREQFGRLPEAGRGLRRRRQQCGRHVLSARRAFGSRAAGGRGRRPLDRPGEHASPLSLWPARRAARQPELRDAGRRRPDLRRPFDLGRSRLSGRRAGAQLLEG